MTRSATTYPPAAPLAPSQAEHLLRMGVVQREHGVRGELKVFPETDDPARFEGLDRVFLGPNPQTAQPFKLRMARQQVTKRGTLVLLALETVATREAAAALRNQAVFGHIDDLPALAEDEVYLHDLVGMQVLTVGGESVGILQDILETPGHPLYVVGREGLPDVLIPGVSAFIHTIDVEAGQVTINPIDGLLDG